jgi:hypothetical protein
MLTRFARHGSPTKSGALTAIMSSVLVVAAAGNAKTAIVYKVA